MTPLIDGDILVYEIGFACEYGKEDLPTFEYVKEVLDSRIKEICAGAKATKPPIIFLTGEHNFREIIALKKKYKGNRDDKPKPFHAKNIIAYLMASYGAIRVDGYEADDAMAMEQWEDYRKYQGRFGEEYNTIICSRDKDLRMVPGWHYSWECGKQGEIGPIFVDDLGEFWEDGLEKKPPKLVGTGLRFFYAQLLMGDKVDNIPGVPGIGPRKAYNLLKDAENELDMYRMVLGVYEEKYEENALHELIEQAHLLWMVRERDEDGRLLMWKPPEEV